VKSLYVRVWLTVVAVLALFALGSGWVFQRQIEQERGRLGAVASERLAAWGELIQRSLPGPDAAPAEQAQALREWSERLRVPLALDDVQGRTIGMSAGFERRLGDGSDRELMNRMLPIRLDDGRTLWLIRPEGRGGGPRAEGARRGEGRVDMRGEGRTEGRGDNRPGRHADGRRPPVDRFGMPLPPSSNLLITPPGWARGTGLLLVLVLLFVAVAAGAFPVVRRLTRRLEALKQGVEQFGAGSLGRRVDDSGSDEVAAVAASFNRAAERIETLVRSNQSLLANASHELRSPLARMKMAVAMLDDAAPAQRERLKQEIHTNIAELDALVEEVLLASRLDNQPAMDSREPVDLLPLAAEEAARVDASLQCNAPAVVVQGDERLLRRAVRNLLENARRYGGDEVAVSLSAGSASTVLSGSAGAVGSAGSSGSAGPAAASRPGAAAVLQVCDRGPGVPEAMRERIFEPFFRMPGHAEREGGVGLGLSLVRQIALRHGGSVRCESRDGGGSCFVLELPA
jgi:signal transduction histidine kinase